MRPKRRRGSHDFGRAGVLNSEFAGDAPEIPPQLLRVVITWFALDLFQHPLPELLTAQAPPTPEDLRCRFIGLLQADGFHQPFELLPRLGHVPLDPVLA